MYLEVALKQRDAGQYTEAEGSFAATVKAYEAAARIGQSDSEVHEGYRRGLGPAGRWP